MIDKLEMLPALAREQHFGRAAEACGVTQPILSAGLKQLEETFGLLLVHRQSRFLGFTPEGERVLDWARRIVGDARAMHQEIRALKQGLAGHLRLAAVPTALPRAPKGGGGMREFMTPPPLVGAGRGEGYMPHGSCLDAHLPPTPSRTWRGSNIVAWRPACR